MFVLIDSYGKKIITVWSLKRINVCNNLYVIITVFHWRRYERNMYQKLITNDIRRDSVVGIATRYRLESPGIESRWGAKLFHTRRDQS
jgi:hypothetical protein